MSDKINSTNSVSAICPQCKKQITVNPSEEVVFCFFCNKAFSVNDAIKQYNEYLERSKAAKKPSDETISKFYAILAQDYKLAEKYLEDVINKEYSQESKKYILFKYSSYSSLCSISNLDTLSKDRIGIEKILNNIHSVNPSIAEMYYKILCASVNNIMSEMYYDYNCNGELAFLKIILSDVKKRFKNRLDFSDRSVDNYRELFYDVRQRWNNLISSVTNDILQYKCWLQKEYDDEYIKYIICKIKSLCCLYVKYSQYEVVNSYWGWTSKKEHCFNINQVLDANICIDNVIKMLEEFYTPIQREKAKKEREESERERDEKEKKYKEAFDKEVAFWNDYITLLKTKKIEKAYELIKTKHTKAHNSEIAKFKKSVFRLKYFGDVSMLQAEELAKLSVDDLR